MSDEMRWWRAVPDTCAINIDHIPTPVGTFYYVSVSNKLGELHRFYCQGLYWRGRDIRIFNARPAVGEWEEAPDPAEPMSLEDFDISAFTNQQEGEQQP